MTVQLISEEHWPGILETEHTAYLDIEPETEEVLKSKWAVTPETCLVSLNDHGRVEAYVLAHAWHEAKPPALFKALNKVPEQTDSLYLHDLAVHKNARGKGLGDLLARKLIRRSKELGFRRITLVAVQGSTAFWQRQGFSEDDSVPVSSSYGDDAVFMQQLL